MMAAQETEQYEIAMTSSNTLTKTIGSWMTQLSCLVQVNHTISNYIQ